MAAVRAAYATILVIDLHDLLASGALIGHLLIRLKALLERAQDGAAQGGLGQEGTACKGISAFSAAPDSCAGPPYSVPPALWAIIRGPALLLQIGHQLP